MEDKFEQKINVQIKTIRNQGQSIESLRNMTEHKINNELRKISALLSGSSFDESTEDLKVPGLKNQ